MHSFSYRYMRVYLHTGMIPFSVSLGRLSSLEQQTSNGMFNVQRRGYDPAASPSGLRIVSKFVLSSTCYLLLAVPHDVDTGKRELNCNRWHLADA